MTIRVTIGDATVDLGATEMTNGAGVTVPHYQPDHLLHATQRALSATGLDCEHVQTSISDARKHLARFSNRGKSCPITHVNVVADDLRAFADELEKDRDDTGGSRWHSDYIEMLTNAARRLEQAQEPPDDPGPALGEVDLQLRVALLELGEKYGLTGVARVARMLVDADR